MENELRSSMMVVASAFATAEDCALSTVSRRCRNDSAFFRRIADIRKSFTARTFDEVMQWFSDHWPVGTDWPATVPRPSARSNLIPGDSPDRAVGSSPDPTVQIPGSLPPADGHRDPVPPAPTGG
jgi:hypothetical protein